MAKELRLRRGNAATTALFVGADSEVTVNSDNHSIHVHDGLSAGGFELARVDLTNVDDSVFAAKAAAAGISGGGGGGGGGGSGAPETANYLVVSNDPTLTNDRRLQAGAGIVTVDGGANASFVISANLSNSAPRNLGSASSGISNTISRSDHVHAMPTATDVGAVPTSRAVLAGTGLTGGGPLTSNVTLTLNASLGDLNNVFLSSPANGDMLIYNGATSRFENSPNYPKITTQSNGTTIGTANSVRIMNFTGGGATLTAQSDPTIVNVNIPPSFTQQQIFDFVGSMVGANSTQNGITVTYDGARAKLNFDVNDPVITLTGAVQGTGTLTNLANLSIATVLASNAVVLGQNTQGNYVATLAGSNAITITNATNTTAGAQYSIAINTSDANFIEDIQDIVGTMVTGSNTETGINVTYDDPNGKLNFVVANSSLVLTGAVAGTATLIPGQSVTLTAVIPDNSIALATQTTGNYIGNIAGTNGILVSGSGVKNANVTIDFDVTNSAFVESMQDIVGSMVAAGIKTGMTVLYDDPNNRLNFSVNSPNLTFTGALTGTAQIVNLSDTTIPLTLANASVILGQHTTGNYVQTVSVSGGGLSLTGSGVGAQVQIASNATASSVANTIVLRDSSGNFVAGTITATLNGQASTAAALATARSISLTGDVTGIVTFDGSANVSMSTSLKPITTISAGSYTSANITVDAYGRIVGISNGSGGGGGGGSSTTGSFTANASTSGQVIIGGETNGAIEIGQQGRASSGTPYIDFHSALGSGDYDVRLQASGGSSASVGSGNLAVYANAFTPGTNNTVSLGVAGTQFLAAYAGSFVGNTVTLTGNASVGGALSVTGNIAPVGNAVSNLGSATTQFNNVYAVLFNGTATSARYADLAERYHADMPYEPGTVVVFGGANEITACTQNGDTAVAGVISTDPAYMMNSEAGSNDTHPYVALVGRVPCKVIGTVRKGQMLTTSEMPGYAMATNAPRMGAVIGKALEAKHDNGPGLIEISVQRF